MRKAIVRRYGAFGDHIHCSMIPRLLYENGYTVHFEYNYKGRQLHALNPYIQKHSIFEPSRHTKIEEIDERWENLQAGYDLVIDLNDSLEHGTMAMEDMREYYEDIEKRLKFDNSYYDFTLRWVGLDEYAGKGIRGEVFYREEEHQNIQKFLSGYQDNFVLLVNLAGTGIHKIYPFMGEVINNFLDKHPNTYAITTGDKQCQIVEWDHPRLIKKSGIYPFRQSLLLAKYVDGVIGCESGLMVGASMWDTRSCQLLTAASKKCHIPTSCKNDYSLQSEAKCSPCFRGPYLYKLCDLNNPYMLPACVMNFPREKVLNQLDLMYEDWADKTNSVTIFKPANIKEVKYKTAELKCPLCYKVSPEVLRKSNDEIFYSCEECGIYFSNKALLKKEIYNKNYLKKYEGFEHLYKEEINKYFEYFDCFENPSFLEIGPTTDVILDFVKDKGFDTCQVDLNEQRPSKHQKIIGNFEDVDIKHKYDVVWATHVFEHFVDPVKAMEKLNFILKNNGILILAMPDPQYINWQFPIFWNHWHAYEHHTLWKKEAILGLLGKNGFELIHEDSNKSEASAVLGDYHIVTRKKVNTNSNRLQEVT